MKRTNCFSLSFLIICLFIALFPHSGFAAEYDLEKLEREVDHYIKEHEDTLAGLATVMMQDGKTMVRTAGYTSIEQGLKVDQDTVFEWGSSSKLFIWISVMQLVEEGRLDLKADIKNYVRDDFHYPSEYDEPITMLHLMNHTAGFDDSLTDLLLLEPDEVPSLKQALEEADVRQPFAPGEVVGYSNYGASLAAYIVEEISGIDYSEYVRENIFTPLDMNQTAIDAEQNDNAWVKEQREKIQGYTAEKEVIFPNNYTIPLYPAGSVVGTATDFAKLVHFLLSDDGRPIFKQEETIELLFEPTAYYPETTIPRIAHGLFALHAEDEVYGHSGNTIAFSSSIYVDRNNKTGLVVMTNQANEDHFSLGIPQLVFDHPTVSKARDLEDATMWEGVYQPVRSPYHGFSKMYGLLNRSHVTAHDTYDLAMNGFHYDQARPGVYVTEDDYSLYGLDTYATHPTYEKVLSSTYSDLILIPKSQHVFELTLLIIGVITGIFSFSYIGLQFIVKIGSGKLKRPKRNRGVIIQHGLNVLVLANIWWIVYRVLEMTSYEALRISFIINILYAVATVGLSAYTIVRSKSGIYSRKENIMSWVTIVASLVICANIVYWEFYW